MQWKVRKWFHFSKKLQGRNYVTREVGQWKPSACEMQGKQKFLNHTQLRRAAATVDESECAYETGVLWQKNAWSTMNRRWPGAPQRPLSATKKIPKIVWSPIRSKTIATTTYERYITTCLQSSVIETNLGNRLLLRRLQESNHSDVTCKVFAPG